MNASVDVTLRLNVSFLEFSFFLLFDYSSNFASLFELTSDFTMRVGVRLTCVFEYV